VSLKDQTASTHCVTLVDALKIRCLKLRMQRLHSMTISDRFDVHDTLPKKATRLKRTRVFDGGYVEHILGRQQSEFSKLHAEP
jgi:hypothetical protein